ncbi:MAG: hypothetical protein KA129_11270 [Microthrixaceae bacterium]|nr:hypothetical protein [Microthrixaceae bacterium]
MTTTADGTVEDGHGNVVERVVDHGDGTATRTFYDTDGEVTGSEVLTGLPIPDPPAADPAAVLATVGASLAAIPANATSTQMRSTLRTLGEQITESIPT